MLSCISTLSSDTMVALKEFYSEKDHQQQRFDNLKAQMVSSPQLPVSMETFSEDWNVSQFWVIHCAFPISYY